MKLRLAAFFLGLMIAAFAPHEAMGAKRTYPHDLLCNGPIAKIADDDPGLALFADSPEPLIDRKIALAIERANSCDDLTKANGQPWSCEDYVANDETPSENWRLYRLQTRQE